MGFDGGGISKYHTGRGFGGWTGVTFGRRGNRSMTRWTPGPMSRHKEGQMEYKEEGWGKQRMDGGANGADKGADGVWGWVKVRDRIVNNK